MTEELKKLYSNSSSEIYFDTIYLSHSLFTNTWYFINNPTGRTLQLEDGTIKTFIPLKFDLVLPTIGSNQQDMGVVLDNSNLMLVKELRKASKNIKEPIILTHNVYIDGNQLPQSNNITLSLTNVTYNNNQVSATATSVDTIGKTILKPLFDYRYKGLYL